MNQSAEELKEDEASDDLMEVDTHHIGDDSSDAGSESEAEDEPTLDRIQAVEADIQSHKKTWGSRFPEMLETKQQELEDLRSRRR